ncbi:MAG: polyphosphate kinase 2 family protein [Gammaproteobacteria bacterium]|jgi:PPK2 family polyphosphate:nucleotide phosphotransferase|nr:polyphosphate kinase 2 family protein [Gammaproteobacteria bacterium]
MSERKHPSTSALVDVDTNAFRVEPTEPLRLGQRPTSIAPLYESKKDYEKLLADGTRELSRLQQLLYAHDRYALLLIFQAMDAAGKDGAIRHVMSGVNPQGCQVHSFKHPSAEELDHDFLWRTHRALPERGRIGIFNRSYYEEVLIVRVRPEILHAQKLPPSALSTEDLWQGRYRSIAASEAHLHRNGTRIIKFFLHLSREEQRKRFLARIEDPDKHWKFSPADMMQREAWDDYMIAYEECIQATTSADSPWFVIPADDKRNSRLIVSRIIVDTMSQLDLSYPGVSEERRAQIAAARRKLEPETPDERNRTQG